MQFKILGIEGATSLELVNTVTKNMSLEDLKACLVKTKLNEEQMKQILINHHVSASEAEEMAATLAVSQAEMAATASTGALTTATGGLTAAFNGLKVAMASHPIGAIAVAAATLIGIVSTAITVFSGWSNNIEDVKDKANELKNDFDNQSNVISENTEKLKSLKSEFEKLSKGVSEYGENISLTGDEYERYKEILQTILGISPSLIEGYDKEGTALANKNGLLEKSIALMEEEQRLEKEKLTRTDNLTTFLNAGKEDINTAKNNMEYISKPSDIIYQNKVYYKGKYMESKGGILGGTYSASNKYIQDIIGVEKDTKESEKDYILRNYEEIYKHIDEIITASQKRFYDRNLDMVYMGFDDSQAESFRNYLLQFKDYLDTREQVNSEFNDYLQRIPESMKEYSGLNDSSKSFLSEWIKKNFTIDENTTEQDIKDFSSKIRKFTKQIADDKDLQSLFDFGAELITDTDNESLSVETYQNKVKEFVDKVNNLNDEDAKLYIKTAFDFEEKGLGAKLKGVIDKANKVDDVDDTIEPIQNESIKTVKDKIQRVKNILVDTDNDKVSGLSMQELNIAYNISAKEGSLTFDDLMAKIKETQQKVNKSTFSVSDYSEDISNLQSNIKALKSAYDKFTEGALDADEVLSLVSGKFPELIDYTDDLGEGLKTLADNEIDKVVEKLKEIDTSTLSEDDLTAYNSLIQYIKDINLGFDNTDDIAGLTGIISALKTNNTQLIEDNKEIKKEIDNITESVKEYQATIASAQNLQVTANDTIFGNIDTNNRQTIQWTKENLKKYKDAYESLGWSAEELEGDISTVMGIADEFDDITIAFTPMLQTDDGAVLLDANTAYEYIWALIDQMPEGWTNEDLLNLDAKGIEMDGKLIKNLIADIGDTAIATSKKMHFTGKDGAINMAQSELEKLAKKYYQLDLVSDDFEGSLSSDQMRISDFCTYVSGLTDEFDANSEAITQNQELLQKYQKLYDQAIDKSLKKIQEAIKNVSSSISTLIGFTKEISSDGALSLSSIDTILTDDTFISLRPYLNDMTKMQTAIEALTSKQKDAYEDLYNADVYESNYDSFHKAAQKITDENENAIFERIQEIEKKVKETEKQYQLDELNWDKLSVEKQNMFQNTNIELLSKQKKLIDDFNDLYDVDVTKFKNATDAKREILKNFSKSFSKSKVMNEIRDLLNETDSLGRDNGSLYIADDNVKKTINNKLSIYGLTWADVLSQLNGTGFTPEGEKSLQSLSDSFFQSLVENNFESLLQPFKITTKQWEDIIKNSNSSGDSKSDTKQYFDWIERRLKKFADNTKRVFSKVKDYITFKGKNSQLLNAIKAIRDEIAVNEQSYNSYLSYANGVNLSEYYKNLVRNGSIDIENITNKDLQEKINKYKEYYDNAMSCKDAIDSLKETEKEYAQQQLSNVEKYYSNRISYANADVEYYNSLDVDNLNKSKNYDAIRKSYNEQISYTQKEINDLTNTLNTLVSDGTIKYQNDEWYEWWGKIQKCNVEVRNLNKNIRDLADEELQDIQTFWDNRITKADSNVKYYNSLDTDNQKINKNYNLIRESYNKQISYTEKQKEQLINTLNSMVKSGDIEEYSDKWYEWQGKIDDCNVSVRELKKSIHDLADEELQDIQTFWDNRIGVYDNTISYINTVGSDTTQKGSKNYKRLSSAYNSQIGYTNKQVSELQARLDKAVKAGDIEKYSDKWYEWTGIIEQGKEKVAELQTNIHQLAVDEFNDIATRYDNLINRIEHKNNLLEESISQTQEKGYIVSTKYYNALITNEQNNISKLSEKRNDLYDSLQQAIKSDNIQEGSEEWHKMVQEIENVDLEIEKANTSVIKFNNSIREIQWQVFDLLQDRISQISTESNFLINLMKNDDLYVKKGQGAGQLTNQGLSTMGLHGVNYNVYMAQSNKYAQEILKIDKQLAKDPYNQTLINRRKELLKLQQDMIISANDEKQAIVSMIKEGIDLELNALKELIDKYNEALDVQKDLYDYQKRIKEQTKEISSLQKQLMAYTNDSSEETKAKVQQLKISLETAKENLQETQYDKFISDQKKLLDDLYDDYETTLNQRLDNVDSLISDMIDNINNNTDTIKQTLIDESGNVGYQISSTMNDIWNSGTKPVLSEYNTNFLNTSNNVISAINNLTNSINNMIIALDNTANKNTTVKTTSKQSTTTVKQTTPTNNSINKTNTNNSKNKTNTNSNKSTNSTSSGFSKGSTNNNSTQQNTNHKNTRTDKDNYGVALAIINGNYGWGAGEVRKKNLTTKGFNYNTVQGIVNKLWKDGYVKTSAWKGKYYGISNLSPYHYNKYKQGQYSINHNQMAWTNENGNSEVIIRRSDGAILTPLAKDDMILSSQATDNLFSIATDPNTFIKESLFGSQNNAGTANINNVNNNCSVSVDTINFNLPNVKNYEDFFYAAQHDKRFEKMVQAMTVDKLFGGSSLKKYRV